MPAGGPRLVWAGQHRDELEADLAGRVPVQRWLRDRRAEVVQEDSQRTDAPWQLVELTPSSRATSAGEQGCLS